jgi:hypothetical protein
MDIDHRAIAIETYNRFWELLEMESPTVEHHTELLTAALLLDTTGSTPEVPRRMSSPIGWLRGRRA